MRSSKYSAKAILFLGSAVFALGSQPAIAQADQVETENADETENTDKEESSEPRLGDFILVEGSRNTAIRRLENDPLPFTVFDQETIQRSNTNSLGEFLTRNLNSNSSANGANNNLNGGLAGRGRSNVALRGLSDRETLILLDGRRLPENRRADGGIGQPDINGIPLSAVERIEVLPSSASGIYGGGATGGVINIILKRDYKGLNIGVSHDTTSRFDYAETRVDISAASPLGENTTFDFFASYRDGTELRVNERPFLENARALALANNPDGTLGTTFLSNTPNIASLGFFGPRPDLTIVGGGAVGSIATSVPIGYGGVGSDGGAALIANGGTINLAPSSTAQRGGGGGNLLTSSPRSISVLGSLNHSFSKKLTGFLEASYSNNKSSTPANAANGSFLIFGGSPGNPFNENVFVSIPIASSGRFESEIDTLRLGGGLTYQIVPDDWFISADLTWNKTTAQDFAAPLFDNSALGAAISSGAVNPFVDPGDGGFDFSNFFLNEVSTQTPSKTELTSFSFRSGGSLPIVLPGGNIVLNMTGEYRDEQYAAVSSESLSFGFGGTLNRDMLFTPSQSQNVLSFYAEAVLPFVEPENDVPAINSLELQIAGRYDRYNIDSALQSANNDPTFMIGDPIARTQTNFSEISPTVALKYSPVEGVILRGSYAEGFLPPSVLSLSPLVAPNFTQASFFAIFGTGDPLRGGEILGSNNGLGGVDVFGGGSPDLKPERTKSYSAGIVLEPGFMEGFRFSADWTRIEKTDAIATLVSFDPNDAADLINLRPDRITRAAPAPGDPFADGPIIALSSRLLNFASQNIESLDFSLDYGFNIENFGDITLRGDLTRNLKNDEQITPTSAVNSILGFSDFIKTRATASLEWRDAGWTVFWQTQYYSGYDIDPNGFGNAGRILSQGSNSIESQMYHDLLVSYDFGDKSSVLKNTKVSLSVINVFDKAPSFDATQLNTTGISVFGDPRGTRFRLSVNKSF